MKLFLGAIVGVFLLWLFSLFVIQPFVIPTESMQPTLNPGDRILVNRTAFWSTPISRGDLVVFDGADSFSSEPGDFVKRVVGVSGDRVVCCSESGKITINGILLLRVPIFTPGTRQANWSLMYLCQKESFGYWETTGHNPQTRDPT
jgi:signal peptidase I